MFTIIHPYLFTIIHPYLFTIIHPYLFTIRYPHLSGGEPLRRALCEYCGCVNEELMVTNGSDDALILICQTYLQYSAGQKRHVLTPTPTYEHFCVNAVGILP